MFIPNNSTAPKLQTAEDLQGDALLHYDAEMELMNLILLSIPNDIYNSVDACTSAKDMWKRVERLMRRTIQNKVDRETRFTNEFDQFVAEPWEALVSVYNFFAQLMNDLERNDMHFPIVTINTKAKKLEKSHDPLALVAHTSSSSRNTSSYYVTHPTFVVDYEDEYQRDDVHTNSEDPLASAMLVNIQSRNSGNVIAPGMYKVVTTHESQTNEAKHDLSSTGMNDVSSVRRPMNRDSHVKNSVLANSKKLAKKVAVYVRKNKQTDNTSKNVISNKENVIDVDVANASKAENLLCVSCMQNVLIPCHDK
ncbi:hypothetical protein Tco_1061185, partial [Tanacetum coccineum]